MIRRWLRSLLARRRRDEKNHALQVDALEVWERRVARTFRRQAEAIERGELLSTMVRWEGSRDIHVEEQIQLDPIRRERMRRLIALSVRRAG